MNSSVKFAITALLLAGCLGLVTAQDATTTPAPKPHPLSPLSPLVGRWQGTGEGQSGTSTVERTYVAVMNGRYLQVANTSTYAPQEKNPKGEKHEDLGMYSYDRGRQKIVFRQFHIEGFVNTYVRESTSTDGSELVFVTESIENIPPGFRGRETYKFTGPDSLTETFEIAEPGKDFQIYTKNTLTRIK